jgi:hypothetical protein
MHESLPPLPPMFTHMMPSFESKATRIIDKFNGGNVNIWRFKIEMSLASIDLWDIVDES